jgi:ABC-2 type transport system ATP-binding protein
LDPLMQQEVHRLLKESKDQGVTVFFSSHILSEVQEVAERVAIIRLGVVVEVADTASLINRSLRRVRVWFREKGGVQAVRQVPGVRLVREDEASVVLEVEGEIDGLIKALSKFSVVDLETERPSLEEVFLAYYESGGKEGE